ncbi:hypothetical protein Poli38472_012959 [Pythium oligandrum]|uniref:Sulfate transporter n=1 Tax=Pythium oligandrum TaxID=41045 RepID=A0A8K1FLZ5_PYTOL|nr:hypothetical protein Poli38472_012959 [Pythium oligandrum]|eukprot:TMW64337.1 hypothetical protein Poli38472_012959 [Pythium oligandrum]
MTMPSPLQISVAVDVDAEQQLASPHARPPPLSPSAHARARMVFETPPLRRETRLNNIQLPPYENSPGHGGGKHPVTEMTGLLGRSRSFPSSMGSYSPTVSRSPRMTREKTAKYESKWQRYAMDAVHATPCVIIAIALNLMICVPFGLSFFPAEWQDLPMPRAVGIQMFLLTTAICQFVFVAKSSFDGPIGMMMVENVPFMHTLSMSIINELGPKDPRVLPTIMVTYALSSVVVGVIFFLLGYFKVGNVVYLFPKHIIVGAIGGIGVFVLQNGIENATGHPFDWTQEGLLSLFDESVVWLWVSSAFLAALLALLTRWIRSPVFPPVFFVSIPPLFYLALLILGISPKDARAHGWFFDKAPDVEFYTMWEQFQFGSVEWSVIPKQTGTILGLTFFSLMHVPINIPSLSLTTDHEADINDELVAHGISNTLGGLCGSVQNYLCYSTSALYYKCGGGGRMSGLAVGCAMLVFFFIGPNAVAYVPRCMAGCLMIHISIDLLKEALIDTYDELDKMELATVWVIAAIMTFWGMNQGIAVGVLLACITFVMQSASLPTCAPIRGSMSASTLRSNAWRTAEALDVLDQESRSIHVVQLHGHLFFGNANKLTEYVQTLFEPKAASPHPLASNSSTTPVPISYLLLDFTLVVGLDSSAADRLTKVKYVCDVHQCRLVFAAVPSIYRRFTEHLSNIFVDQSMFYVASDLNGALEWCEDSILQSCTASRDLKTLVASSANDECAHLRSLQQLMPDQPLRIIHDMLEYFELEELDAGQVIWKQGRASDRALLLIDGQLQSIIEEEAGTTEDIAVGAIVGELCLLTGEKRKTTVVAKERSVVYTLTREKLEEMQTKDSHLAFLFQGIALRYTSHRLQYVGNRIWETKCLPI